jgi:hypothetical protein
MTLWNQQQVNRRVLMIGAAALVFVWLLLNFYIDQRHALIEERNAKLHSLEDATSLLQREKDLRQLTARMGMSVTSDSSAAEGQLLHLMHDWENRAGAKNASFQRVNTGEEHGFIRLTFQVSAAGNMPAVAGLLYEVETASIPLRVDTMQVHPKTDGDDEVQIRMEISTLCRGNASKTSEPNADDAAQLARGPE